MSGRGAHAGEQGADFPLAEVTASRALILNTRVTHRAADRTDRVDTSEDHLRNGGVSDSPVGRPASPAGAGGEARADEKKEAAVAFQTHHVIQFSAGPAFIKKVEQVKSLFWHRLPAHPTFEQVFALAMDLLIEKKDPAARNERRASRGKGSKASKPQPPAATRHVPSPVRDQVFLRDKGQCTYTAADGRRCASTRALQIDHVTPVARGGPSTPGNLRLLCAYHNRLEAERILGPSVHQGGP